MAFVRGDRAGLIRLKKVLPNIFGFFKGCDQEAILLECGLYPHPGKKGVMTFYLNADRDGNMMINPGWKEIKREDGETSTPQSCRSEGMTANQLMDLYDGLSSSWSCSASNS